jgi:hypothetical protein
VFERRYDSSYERAFAWERCQPHRMNVPAPIALAMPRSSPAGQGGAGTSFFYCARTASGSAATTGALAKHRATAATSREKRGGFCMTGSFLLREVTASNARDMKVERASA